MGRIRSIKPEFPQSESIGKLSRDARLLFIQLWTLVDDSGRTRAASRMLASLLYPYDEDAASLIDGWMEELEHGDHVRRYVVEGCSYLEIINFLKHQKIDKPSASKLPPFAEASPKPREGSPNPRESSTTDQEGIKERIKDPEGEVEGTAREPLPNGPTSPAAGFSPDEPSSKPFPAMAPPFEWPGQEPNGSLSAAQGFSDLKDNATMVARAVTEHFKFSSQWDYEGIRSAAELQLRENVPKDELTQSMILAWDAYTERIKEGKHKTGIRKKPQDFFGDGTWADSKLWGLKKGVKGYG